MKLLVFLVSLSGPGFVLLTTGVMGNVEDYEDARPTCPSFKTAEDFRAFKGFGAFCKRRYFYSFERLPSSVSPGYDLEIEVEIFGPSRGSWLFVHLIRDQSLDSPPAFNLSLFFQEDSVFPPNKLHQLKIVLRDRAVIVFCNNTKRSEFNRRLSGETSRYISFFTHGAKVRKVRFLEVPKLVENPKVPLYVGLKKGIRSGTVMIIKGVPFEGPVGRFNINLLHWGSIDIPVHFDVRLNYYGYVNRFLIVSRIDGGWEREDFIIKPFPFKYGKLFVFKIAVIDSGYQCTLDDQLLPLYNHREKDLESIDTIEFMGDIDVKYVEIY